MVYVSCATLERELLVRVTLTLLSISPQLWTAPSSFFGNNTPLSLKIGILLQHMELLSSSAVITDTPFRHLPKSNTVEMALQAVVRLTAC